MALRYVRGGEWVCLQGGLQQLPGRRRPPRRWDLCRARVAPSRGSGGGMSQGEEKLTMVSSDAMVDEGDGYATTIVDEIGFPLGLLYPDGSMTVCAPSGVGTVR